jgi:hypothetical protein
LIATRVCFSLVIIGAEIGMHWDLIVQFHQASFIVSL